MARGGSPYAVPRIGQASRLPLQPDEGSCEGSLAEPAAPMVVCLCTFTCTSLCAFSGTPTPVDAIAPAMFITVLISDNVEGAEQRLDTYCRTTYGLPYQTARTIQAMVAGPADHVAATLARYASAGAEHLVCRLAAPSLDAQLDQLELIAEIARPTAAGPDSR